MTTRITVEPAGRTVRVTQFRDGVEEVDILPPDCGHCIYHLWGGVGITVVEEPEPEEPEPEEAAA